MNDIKKNLRIIFALFFVMFASLTAYIIHFELVVSSQIVNTGLNPRMNMIQENVVRGNIYDTNGNILVEQTNYSRNYIYGSAFAHTIGYTDVGRFGIEDHYNLYLMNLSNEIFQRINYISVDGNMYGDSLQLTLDRDLQRFAYEQLGNNIGSIVVLEPSTGAIRAMVSSPSFNPNTIATEWDHTRIRADSPLFNRATQGGYPPGSTFKTITALLGLKLAPDFTHYCTGSIFINDHRINNFGRIAHGNIDITRAFALSCNTFFVALADYIGPYYFQKHASEMFPHINFSLNHSQPQFNFIYEDGMTMLMQTSIGQGQTLTSPLYLALLAAAVANDGYMPQPFIVQNVLTYRGASRKTFTPEYTKLFDEYYAQRLTEMMVAVVTTGTGVPAALTNYQLAGKTGTAEVDHGDSHGLFIGFAPADEPRYTIAVVLENSDGTGPVLPIVRNVLNFALSD
ncbi:MAG: penicillin-binding transpeptidase domain-containing protein [Defluviitaleaceae bacterium]|nr:penicillin-binding transpeptidase domain-containing protein [Defluviitaleaceae bacterium]